MREKTFAVRSTESAACLTIARLGKKLLRMVETLGKFSHADCAEYFWSPARVC